MCRGFRIRERVGTDLTHVGEKLSTGFIEHWVDYPNNFWPSTRMPHFFHQENNTESSANAEFDPHPVLRGETEVKAMAHYLKVFSKPLDIMPLPDGMEGDAGRGEELLTSIGCLACHVDLDAKDPLDSDGRSFGEKWIVTDIAMAKAEAQVESMALDGKDASPEEKQGFIDAALTEAKAAYDKMSKNDRARYASRRFDRARRDKSSLAAKTEKFVADIESRDADPLKMYVTPEFVRQGPELSGMGTKLVNDPNDPAQVEHGKRWLYTWLSDPRHYSSYTVMPRMFREGYYQGLSPEEQKKRNDKDILDVSAYLLSLRNDDFPTVPFEATSAHDAEMERLILQLLAGQNTESVSKRILADEKADPSDEYGPLTRSIIAQTTQSFGGTDEAKAQIAALIAAKSGSLKERQKLYFGMKMISHYGCYSCHTIAGFEEATRPGTELTTWAQKFMSQLDFAFFSPVFEHDWAETPDLWSNLYLGGRENPEKQFKHFDEEFKHLIRDIGETADDLISGSGGVIPTSGNVPQEVTYNHASFAYHKMRNPRIWDREKEKKPYEKLKMPNFFFTESEARAITTYVLSRRDAGVRETVKIAYGDKPEGRIARGRELARELNCIGCHTIEANREATIHQYYSEDPSKPDDFKYGMRFKPPLLWGEGAKVQYDWLFGFLNNVEMLRPWLLARMPSFHLTTEDATILVEYFAGLSESEAALLKDKLAPVARHLQQVHSGGAAGGLNPHWFQEEKFADTAAFLKSYVVRHKLANPFEFDVSGASDAAEATSSLNDAYTKAVSRANFISGVFDIAFPYNDLRSHAVSDDRFKLGEEFFYDQKCLACHVGGDPTVPGTTTDIKAPNFALAHKRLQYDWIIKWLQDPQAIQPGANMPQIFQGGNAYISLPEDQRLAKEAKFGKTIDEQGHLMVDFLFALGERKYTAIQPGATDKPAETESSGDMEFDFDSGGEDKKKDEEVEFDFDG
ncbi:MAG: c-type cytochrome [Planctomycetes bacterium]|nr:c-type cytochrome [Planctomycetota bacterium]